MASTFSTNLNLELQGTGDNVGTWGVTLNAAALDVVDNAMGDTQTISLSSGTVNINTAQSQVANYVFTGALAGNVIVNWPAIGRIYTVTNSTTNNFTVTLRRNGTGTTVVIARGRTILIILSSTGVSTLTFADVPVSMVAAFAGQQVPINWLECDGAAVSRTTYESLFILIGTTYGPGNGTTTFNIPDLRGYFVRGWNHGSGTNPDAGRSFGSTQSSANLAHTHTGTTTTNGLHSHEYNLAAAQGTSATRPPRGSGGIVDQGTTDDAGSHNHTFTTNSSGGTESRPYNVAMMYCIRVV